MQPAKNGYAAGMVKSCKLRAPRRLFSPLLVLSAVAACGDDPATAAIGRYVAELVEDGLRAV